MDYFTSRMQLEKFETGMCIVARHQKREKNVLQMLFKQKKCSILMEATTKEDNLDKNFFYEIKGPNQTFIHI